MNSQYLLDIHIGYRSVITLDTGKEIFCCNPGDLHELTNKNVSTVIDLLEQKAVSSTGMIRKNGHALADAVTEVQNLPAIYIGDRTVTSIDIRNLQAAKAKVASAVFALLNHAEMDATGGAVYIHTIDGQLPLADAVRIGMLPDGLTESAEGIGEDVSAQKISLDSPAVIHSYTEHVMFP